MRKIIIFILMIFFVSLSVGDLYRTDVDSDYGFYTVHNLDNLTERISYTNKTLEIYTEDVVEWRNMADPDETLTIDGFEIVDANTFGGIFYHTLRWNYQTYSYTFNKSGTYRVHIEEYPRLKSQTIIVKDLYVSNPELKHNEISKPEFIVTTSVTTPKIEFKETETNNLILYIIFIFVIIIIGLIIIFGLILNPNL